MARPLHELSGEEREFCDEYHLATLTTQLANGDLHSVPVGFTVDWQRSRIRVICSADSQKALNAQRGSAATVCSVDGGRWLSFVGNAQLSTEAEDVAEAVAAYASRYREPRPNPNRGVVLIDVRHVLGNASRLQNRTSKTPGV